ncbi:hypothetical protein [Streptomyces sp. NPDC059165]|uniref:hypothetical protein n=1 Tax=Streptomyces sp. NPDC059165 TaxID=3346751 RepID=UPI0036BEF47A
MVTMILAVVAASTWENFPQDDTYGHSARSGWPKASDAVTVHGSLPPSKASRPSSCACAAHP